MELEQEIELMQQEMDAIDDYIAKYYPGWKIKEMSFTAKPGKKEPHIKIWLEDKDAKA